MLQKNTTKLEEIFGKRPRKLLWLARGLAVRDCGGLWVVCAVIVVFRGSSGPHFDGFGFKYDLLMCLCVEDVIFGGIPRY